LSCHPSCDKKEITYQVNGLWLANSIETAAIFRSGKMNTVIALENVMKAMPQLSLLFSALNSPHIVLF